MPRKSRRWAIVLLVAIPLGCGLVVLLFFGGVWVGSRSEDLEFKGGRVYDRAAVFRFEGERIEVPLRMSREWTPIVDVVVNDEGPFPFVLDTGAPETSLATDLCETLALDLLGGALTRTTRWA